MIATSARRKVLISLIIGAASLSGCNAPSSPAPAAPSVDARPIAHFDGPGYSSVQELGQAGDVVIAGTIVGLRTQISQSRLRGRTPGAGATDLPLALYEIRVERKLKGEAADTVLVTSIDTEKLNVEQVPFTTGAYVVFFLKASTVAFEGVPVHAVVGRDQGRLEIDGGRVRASTVEGARSQPSVADGQTVDEIAAQL